MKREEIFEQASKMLKSEFEALRKTYAHSVSKGTELERVLIEFLKKKLPKRFGVVSGFILDKVDNVSTQQDVIIYDALNTPVYSYDANNCVIPNDNVAIVIEVKTELNAENLRESFAKAENTKGLVKTLDDQKIPRPESCYYDTQSFIFAYSSSISLQRIAEIYRDETKRRVSRGLQMDGVFVLDKGFISLALGLPNGEFGPAFVAHSAPGVSGAKLFVHFQEFKEKTLDYFLRLMLPHLSFFYQRVDHPGFEWTYNCAPTDDLLIYEVPLKEPERNDTCFCTSEKKYKKCHGK